MSGTRTSYPNHISTPQARKANAEIDDLLKDLVAAGLPLRIPDGPSSPSLRGRTSTDQIINNIRFLFFQDHSALIKLILEFKLEFSQQLVESDPVETLETRLKDLSRLVKDQPKKRTPFTERLHNVRKEHAQTPIKSFFPQTMKRSSPDNEEKDDTNRKSRRCNDSFGRSISTTSATSLTGLNSSGNSSLRASTAATSFSIHNDTDNEPPPSSYGSDFGDATQSLLLDGVMDHAVSKFSENPIHRTVSADTIASETEQHQRQDSPHNQLMDELKETATRDRTLSESPSTSDSPRKKHFLIRSLGQEKINKNDLPNSMASLPFHLQWSIARVILEHKPHTDDLERRLRKFVDRAVREQITKDWLETWIPAAELQRTTETFYRAKMTLDEDGINRSSGLERSLLRFDPQKPGDEALCRLERKFGAQRFLTVTYEIAPKVLSNYPLKADVQDFEKGFRKFLRREQVIYGHTFRCFYLEKKKDGEDLTYRVHYFAIEGPKLPLVPLQELLDWALNLNDHKNLKMLFPKLMARMDLYLSRTTAAWTFEPEQVRWCEWRTELIADETPEATEFNDQRFKFPSPSKTDGPVVMNDGCSLISPAAARSICERLKITGNRPSAFQGRINGAKGMWFLSGPYDSSRQDITIDVAPSQRKVHARDCDFRSSTAEPARWTLDIVNFSTALKSSSLHMDFLPILEDRGVPRGVLVEVVNHQLSLDFRNFMEAVKDPVELRKWISSNISAKEIRNRELGIDWIGGLPSDDLESAIYLLESGFRADCHDTLADFVFTILRKWLQDMVKKLKIRLNKTLMPYGIADHKRVLKPGEIFLAFSQPFTDPDTDESWSHLEGDVLVARHPAMRNSDVQRVRAVYKPELSHLRDVVVFPSRGQIPLAHKLQGGDYDGDTFWICFDQRIVRHFRNAPAPQGEPDPKKYGIRQNKDTLADVLKSGSPGFENIIHRLFRIRMNDDQLGRVTYAHKRAAYRYGSLTDSRVNKLADVHDLIIDATKNGYDFGEADFKDLMKSIPVPMKLDTPAYQEAMEDSIVRPRVSMNLKVNEKSILDVLVIRHILPQIHTFLHQVREKLHIVSGEAKSAKLGTPDPDLLRPWEDFKMMSKTNKVAKHNATRLLDSIHAVSKEWGQRFGAPDDTPLADGQYRNAVSACWPMYTAIMPVASLPSTGALTTRDADSAASTESPDLSTMEGMLFHYLIHRDAPHTPTRWELIRASALYHYKLGGKSAKLAFAMGGKELGYLKAMSRGQNWRVITKEAHAVMKPRTTKRGRMWKGKVTSMRSSGGSDDEG
ncbi:RNA dependent RNA polymerase-domain-containing protein [Elsinoe ampelina]|uniref:RNA-dependent RNA polymerase n=1 Tax=Elsinoe ampelina TaxID=302913 RepID=A0A6A6G9Y3_9PEZI|nr:RNA dependent RNA polymerase-domain-containing protein [Elsinoe ampelina]